MFKKFQEFQKKLQAKSDKVTEKLQNTSNNFQKKYDTGAQKFISAAKESKTTGDISAIKELLSSCSHLSNSVSAKLIYIGGHYGCISGGMNKRSVLFIEGEGLAVEGIPQFINLDEIKSIEFKSEQEVQRDVKLPKIGKKENNNYMLINCEINGMNYTMMFKAENTDKLYNKLFIELMNRNNN